MNVILRGEKIFLRPVEMRDIDSLMLINAEEVREYLQLVHPINEVSERKWLETLYSPSANQIVLAIVPQGRDEPVGTTGFHAINWVDRNAEFGIVIFNTSYWNRGVGTEATHLMLRYGFEHLNFHRIHLRVYEYNKRAMHVYEKCGFTVEGRMRQARCKHGKYHDVLMMSILSDEYFSSLQAEP